MKLEIAPGRKPGYAAIVVFAGVVVSLGYAAVRLLQLIPSLPCFWRVLLGTRCTGCGTTTTVQLLMTGHPLDAFRINPLIAALYVFGALICLNALAGITLGRRVIIRLSRVQAWIATAGLLALFGANWVYVINS